jgi:hypothetical protein
MLINTDLSIIYWSTALICEPFRNEHIGCVSLSGPTKFVWPRDYAHVCTRRTRTKDCRPCANLELCDVVRHVSLPLFSTYLNQNSNITVAACSRGRLRPRGEQTKCTLRPLAIDRSHCNCRPLGSGGLGMVGVVRPVVSATRRMI